MSNSPDSPSSPQHPPAPMRPVSAQGTGRVSNARPFLDPFTTSVGLRVVNAEFQGLLLVLPVGTHSMGRSEECDHHLPHATVSRRHCAIRVDESGIKIDDTGSYHGVLVNNQPVKTSALNPGDILHLGDVMLTIEFVPNHKLAIETHLRYPGQHRISGDVNATLGTAEKAFPEQPRSMQTFSNHHITNTSVPSRGSNNFIGIIARASQRIAKPSQRIPRPPHTTGGPNAPIRYNPGSTGGGS